MNRILIIVTFFTIGFDCNFLIGNSIENPRIIYLCGEDHYYNDDERFKRSIIKSASEGQLVFAAEGLMREIASEKEISKKIQNDLGSKGEAYIYGVEDPLFHVFQKSLTLNSSLRSMKKRQADWDLLLQKQEIIFPFIRQSIQKFLTDFWANESLISNPIFVYLKMYKDALMNKSIVAQATTLSRRMKSWADSDWIDFTHKTSLILSPMIATQIPAEKIHTLEFLLSCIEDFELEDNCDAHAKSFFFMDRLHLDLRDDFIINNLEEIYSIANTKKKAVVCILGYAHIEGVKAGLEQKGFVVLGREEFLESGRKSEL